MAVSTGTVLFKDGKYILDVGGRAEELLEKTVSDPTLLKSMVGKKIEVTYSAGPVVFPVAITLAQDQSVVVVKRRRMTCYLPRPDIVKRMGDIDRTKIAITLLNNKMIDKQTYEAII